MITDFEIRCEHPAIFLAGDAVVHKPWIWTATLKKDGRRYDYTELQSSRNPKEFAEHVEHALGALR